MGPNIIIILGMIIEALAVANKTVKIYQEVVGRAVAEGRDVSQAELDKLRSDRKKAVASYLVDD